MNAAKEKAIKDIRTAAFVGARLRLKGAIERAQVHEDRVDALINTAELAGWGDEAFEAENEAQQAAHTVHVSELGEVS